MTVIIGTKNARTTGRFRSIEMGTAVTYVMDKKAMSSRGMLCMLVNSRCGCTARRHEERDSENLGADEIPYRKVFNGHAVSVRRVGRAIVVTG